MKKEFGLVVVLLVIMGFIFSIFIQNSYDKQINNILKEEENHMEISYKAISNMYAISLKTIIDEQVLKPEIIDILSQANVAPSGEKALLRGKLYRKLWGFYKEKLTSFNINQFQFYLNDGRVFLRFEDPTASGNIPIKFRKTIKDVTKNKTYSSGFEGGYIAPGFRHLFPISWDGKYIGSVEVSLTFEALRKEMSKLLPNMELSFIMKRYITIDLVGKKHKQRFLTTNFAKDFVIENPAISKLDKNRGSLFITDTIKQHILNDSKIYMSVNRDLKKGKPFSYFTHQNTNVYSVHFIPIFDTSGKLAAYIMGSGLHSNILNIEKQKNIILVSGLLAIIVMGTFLFLLIASRKKSILQKNEIETIANTIEKGIFVLDKDGYLTFINKNACKMLGYNKEELMGTLLHNKIHYHESPDVECKILGVVKDIVSYTGEENFIKSNDTIFPVAISSTPLLGEGEVLGSVTVFRDITDEKIAQEKVEKLAYHDSLTDLPNRKLFFDRLGICLSKNRRFSTYSGIIYVDLDDFKRVNDTFGHKAGDDLLVLVTKRVLDQIRQEDTLARLGGDEFAVIIDQLGTNPDIAKETLTVIVKKIFNIMESPFNLNGINYDCNLSMGAVVFNGNISHVDEIVDKADTSMYDAKRSGKNTFRITTF